MENIDLKEIERRAYLTYHKDGILDIYIGMGIMTLASVFFFEVFVSTGTSGIMVLLPILYAASKKQYTIPRLGYVKFSQSTMGRARNSITLALLLGSISAVAGLFAFYSILSTGNNWIEPLIANWKITLAAILLVVFSLFGYVSDLRRMYYYGMLSLIVFVSGMFLPIPGYMLILAVGGIISINGITLLYRFTQEYPIEKGHENE
jgi:hypothetical protein